MKLGIVIIAFNAPDLIIKQLELLKRFCKDEYDLIIVDNSSDYTAIQSIRYHTKGKCIYLKSNAQTTDSSESHAFASNLAYTKFKDEYQYLFFLDHDCLPFKHFSVVEILSERLMAGLAQEKHEIYFWPGCFMFNAEMVKNVDFGTRPGLDTGGATFQLIKEHGVDNCIFFSETYEQNPYFKKSQYDFYSIIGETFMHCLNGSNWAKSAHHEERLNSLYNVLQLKCETQ